MRKSHNLKSGFYEKMVVGLLLTELYIHLFWIDVGRVPGVYADYLQTHSVYFIWSRFCNICFLHLNSGKVAKRFLAEIFSQRWERGISHPTFLIAVFESMMNSKVFLHMDLHVKLWGGTALTRPDQTIQDRQRFTQESSSSSGGCMWMEMVKSWQYASDCYSSSKGDFRYPGSFSSSKITWRLCWNFKF